MGISGEFYNLIENYFSGIFQRVALNGKTSSWRPILADVAHRSILGSPFFLIYIKDLLKELTLNVK